MLKKGLLFGMVLSLAAVIACGGDSKAPVSPSPADAIDAEAAADGSTLKVSAPPAYLPTSGSTLDSNTPNLVVTSASGRFVTATGMVYRFAVETPAGTEVYRSETVASSDLIAQRVPEGRLAWGTAYRWHARAEVGSSAGPWSSFATFQTPVEPPAPTLDDPGDGSTVPGVAPKLYVKNGGVPAGGSVTGLEHRFVIETTAGVVVVNSTAVSASAATTFVTPVDALQELTTYRWRARAERGTAFVGPWSRYWTFTTSTPVRWPTTPSGIIEYVANEYPEYLVATSTLHEREVNMRFLRDRIIETGICGGLDLAWNLKRGVGPRSTDAILYREVTDRARDRVIDVAAGFDDHDNALQLHWVQVEGPPGYDRYLPRPSCK